MRMSQPTHQPADDREALLRDPELRQAIERVLLGRVPEADVPDVVQETLVAVHWCTSLPEDRGERRQYILGIARTQAAARWRRAARGLQTEPLDEKDELVAPDTTDAATNDRDLLVKMVAEVPESQLETLQWLARHLLGESLADLAREANDNYEAFAKRVLRMKKRILDAGKVLGGALVAVLALGAAWYVWGPKQQIALPQPTTMPSVAPATSSHDEPAPEQPDPADLEEARTLRSKAFQACTDYDWGSCLDDLDQAERLDPAGERDPLVQAARQDAETGVRQHYKPGGEGWKPIGPRPYVKGAP
jgi:DNA-directed RNA polymerase specialized sigma24 family protein